MIKLDQPTIFGDEVIVQVSSCEDGQMQLGWSEPDELVVENRQLFLGTTGLSAKTTALVRIKYSDDMTYDRISEVSAKDGGVGMFSQPQEASDCLVTATPGLGLFLPVADCGATVIYDCEQKVLALAHLGRHSTIAHLARKVVTYLMHKHHSNPADLKVWVSPSISAAHYILAHANFAQTDRDWNGYCRAVDCGFAIDVQGFNRAQFIASGVLPSNIQISGIDTATDKNYWSHHTERTVRGNKAPPRFAVVAALKKDAR